MTPKMDDIPVQPGTYALILELVEPRRLVVGKLGIFDFPTGFYIYLGSARGPGGIRARLGRHLGGVRAPHWHIDYLRAAAKVWGYRFQPNADTNLIPQECEWSQALTQLPGASILIPNFGASDCKAGCLAHLIYFPPTGIKDLLGFWIAMNQGVSASIVAVAVGVGVMI